LWESSKGPSSEVFPRFLADELNEISELALIYKITATSFRLLPE